MSNYVITIARGFGSGGNQTALQLSKMLSIPCYEREILQMASEYSGISAAKFSQVDERLRGGFNISRLRKYSSTKETLLRPADKKFVSDDNLFLIQSKIIEDLARSESCIIIGKCADYVLQQYDNVVSFYIEAPREACLKYIIERYGVEKQEAEKMIIRTDRYRSDYYKFYTGGNYWTNPVNYDLTLNSDRVGRENCATVIKAYMELKGFI